MHRSDDRSATARAAVCPRTPSDTDRTLAYRRSLRASRVRRATAVLRRRRTLRSRRAALAVGLGALLASAGAVAQQQTGSTSSGLSTATITAAQRALGVQADGIVGPVTRRATRSFQRRYGLVVDGIIGPQTLRALGIEVEASAVAASVDPVLQRIAECESGGDPAAISADGLYRGKYQFSMETWREVGGSGDPALASEAEQDRRAAKLLALAGTAPWPNCA